tara:strand:+ start:215 stop:1654 length:1440 start_codon:yes stop_codon:yes gene_type:complete
MYAALHYDIENVDPVDVMNDIASVLTGETNIATLSARIQPDDSYISTTVTTSNWVEQGRLQNSAGADKSVFLKQPMTDDPTRFRYMELFIPQKLPGLGILPGDPSGEGISWDFFANANPGSSTVEGMATLDENGTGVRTVRMDHCVLVRFHAHVDDSTLAVNGPQWSAIGATPDPAVQGLNGEIYPAYHNMIFSTGANKAINNGLYNPYNKGAGVPRAEDLNNSANWRLHKEQISFAFKQAQGETMLLITASDRHVGFQSFYNNLSTSSGSPFLFEHTRLSPWDTIENAYDPYVFTTVPISTEMLTNSLGGGGGPSVMPFFKFDSMPNLKNIGTSFERYDYFKCINDFGEYNMDSSVDYCMMQLSTLGGASPSYGTASGGVGPRITDPNDIVGALGLDVNLHLDSSLAYQPILIPFGAHNIGLGHFGGDISSGTGVYLLTSGVGQTHHALTVNNQDYRIWAYETDTAGNPGYRLAIIDG